MKCTPQKTMASASGRVRAALASWKESPTKSAYSIDLVALVEVAQHDGAVPQRRFGGADPGVEFGVAGQLVLLRELALPRGGGRGDVGGGGPGP